MQEISEVQRLSKRVAGLKPSGIRKFFDIVATMKDVISLGIGEPDFTTPNRYSMRAFARCKTARRITHPTTARSSYVRAFPIICKNYTK